jgi:hypothetical protein
MVMLEPEQVRALAVQLLEANRLTKRQFDCWNAARFQGMPFREAAQFLRRRENGEYDISYWTVMMESRYAHEQVVQAVEDIEEGPVRFEHSVHSGSDVWDVADNTLHDVTRKVRIVLPKKNANFEGICPVI